MKQRVQLTNDMTGCTLYHNQSEYIRRINSDQAYAQGRIWFPTKCNGITVTHLMQRPPHPVGTSEQIHHLFKKKRQVSKLLMIISVYINSQLKLPK